MGLFDRVKVMFGMKTAAEKSAVDPTISRAIQRNERASEQVQVELLKMSDTLKAIAGRMK